MKNYFQDFLYTLKIDSYYETVELCILSKARLDICRDSFLSWRLLFNLQKQNQLLHDLFDIPYGFCIFKVC